MCAQSEVIQPTKYKTQDRLLTSGEKTGKATERVASELSDAGVGVLSS